MSVSDFWRSTVRDVINVIFGYEQKRLSDLKWLRWQTAALINIHLGKRDKIKATDLFKTSDETPDKPVQVDPEVERAINAKWDAEMAEKFNVNGQ